MRALDRKLVRNLWQLRGQVLAVAMVVASGVAVMVMSLSTIEALDETATAYYERYRFADVFATAKRAPERLARRIAALPGVQAVETRIMKFATLDVAGFDEPVIGSLVSIPERGGPVLNRLALRAGRLVAPGRADEVVLNERFAEGHGLAPGGHLAAVINGKKRRLTVVGIALSPEFVYAIGPGALIPDEKRFGILWMGRAALEAAYDLDGAFTDVAITLLRDAAPETVIDRLDRLLAPYGGTGAIARKDQTSNWFLMNELTQLEHMAHILPTIFLAVAVFLCNMLLVRMIATERAQIGLLKAFGYTGAAIGWHYAKLVIVIAGIGIVAGWALGLWLGWVNTGVYAEFYRFPILFYRPGPAVLVAVGAITIAVALLGTIGAVQRAARLAPAEAMNPPAPPYFAKGGFTGADPGHMFDQPTRMILRYLLRWPARAALTGAGIAMAVAVLLSSLQWIDAIDHLVETQFFRAQHQDVTVSLIEARPSTVLGEFERLPGVLASEPERSVRVRFRAGPNSRRGAIQGVKRDARLSVVHDISRGTIPVPPGGLVMSSKMSQLLGVSTGDRVTVEVLEQRRPVWRLPVTETFETYFGSPVYINIETLDRLMRQRPTVNLVHLKVDERRERELFRELKELPHVSAVSLRRAAVDLFHEALGEWLLFQVAFFIGFACTLSVGVIYNSGRIAVSERGRELATLRVLGFSRAEVSYILLGEVAILTALALPAGCLAGYGLVALFVDAFDTELFRLPLVIEPSTYGVAILVTLAAAVVSAALVGRKVVALDLIAVLKARE
jgi:putative ABC transport system permease protein